MVQAALRNGDSGPGDWPWEATRELPSRRSSWNVRRIASPMLCRRWRGLRRQPDDPCRMPPRSPLEAAILREIGADPTRMSTRSTRLSGSCTRLRRPSRLRAVRRGCPRVSILLCASVREADPGPNRGPMTGYRDGPQPPPGAPREAARTVRAPAPPPGPPLRASAAPGPTSWPPERPRDTRGTPR